MKTSLAWVFGLGVLACGDSGAGGSSNAGGSPNGGAGNGAAGNGGAANGGNGGAANGGNGGAANGGNGGAANGGNGGAANGGNGGAANGGSAANGGAGGCVADCGSQVCGDDGCNGSCGDCAPAEVCTPAGQCILPASDLTSFFVSSVGNMNGDFGGISGADMFCQQLAQAASLGNKTWRAYLSTSNMNARDRIGTGPWYNSLGELVASSVNTLHSSGIAMNLMRDEYMQMPPIGEHDIITGSTQNGMATTDTCDNWTSSAQFNPRATVGHFDSPNPVNMFDNWNSTHPSNGCDAVGLSSTAGSARIYCFAL
jgi:hypothetical protein